MMIRILVLLSLVSIAAAIDCSTSPNGYYCNADKSYTLCNNGHSYRFACAAGTGCQCGTNQVCSTPCTFLCETGSSPAQAFCQSRINMFPGEQGYFCNPDGSGFYQCVRDAYCPSRASPRSALLGCPTGTECRCSNTREECSSGTTMTPCTYPAQRMNMTSQCTTMLNCANFVAAMPCMGNCNNTNAAFPGSFCFTDADTDQPVCGANFPCSNPNCNHNADCGAGNVCVIDSCCGPQGFCTMACPSNN